MKPQETMDMNTNYLNKIAVGNCLQMLTQLEPSSVDLCVFSPPYDGIRDYQGEWSLDFHQLGIDLFRVIKTGGVVAVVIGDGTKNFAKSLTTFRLAVDWCDKVGWKMFETCIYYRDGNPGAWWSQRFRVDHEYVLIFFKGQRPKSFNKSHLMVPSKHAGKVYSGTDRLTNGGFKTIQPKEVNPNKCRGSVWRYSTSNTEGNRLKLKHPATYPDKLAEDVIRCFSVKGDVVLDPFVGSGTSAVTASRWERNYIGIDISEEYAEIARERVRLEGACTEEGLFSLDSEPALTYTTNGVSKFTLFDEEVER
ncbi:MAG: site-specific DNA-methyltransferase [Armatimonadetes bacterium]|nr:site-specific DNA-methyltransferase [Armatimonadota bacterium]